MVRINDRDSLVGRPSPRLSKDMEVILHELAQILLRALPTFFLLILLHFYMKHVFFRPLGKVLRARYEASEGARLAAQGILEKAAVKTAEYEAALRRARSEVYEKQEHVFKELQEQQDVQLGQARKQAEASVNRAKADLARDVESAKDGLSREGELLANLVVEAILGGRAA